MRHETFIWPDPMPGVPKPAKAPAREIIDCVAAWHGVDRGTIVGRSRRPLHCVARHDAVAAVWTAYPNLSLAALGRIFDGRDHTTIYHALKMRGLK